ncbi:MAG: DUF6282 family protein [archaeon]
MRPDIQLLKGSIDLHVHSTPHTSEKRWDIFDLARQVVSSEMGAVVVKDHYTMTADRAVMVSQAVPGARIFGGTTLNLAVGGINPEAVKPAIRFGAKIVWMPTLSASSDLKSRGEPYEKGVSVFADGIDKKGKLLPEVEQVLNLIADNDIILATGHLSGPEIVALVDKAKSCGVTKIVVNHPQFRSVGLSIDVQRDLAKRGAYMEECLNFCTPHNPVIKPNDLADQIRQIGSSQCIMATDMGQLDNFAPTEGMRVFIRLMLDRGFSESEVRMMTSVNPARLLGLQ